jgi:hypothetical protein
MREPIEEYDRPTSYVPKDHPMQDAAAVNRKKETVTVFITQVPICKDCGREPAVDGEILCRKCLAK